MREEIVERSIAIFRNHGMKDEQNKKEILEGFSINEKALDDILSTYK